MTDVTLADALATSVGTARNAERDLFGGLGAALRERPIRAGDWSPKDVQAHLSAWKARQADRFGAAREGRELAPSMYDQEEDAVNAELRAARVDWDWEAIVAEADSVTDRLVAEIQQADAATIRESDRLLKGTFGNGVLHTLIHVRWLVEAGVPFNRGRVSAFEDETLRVVTATALPERARAVGLYDLACHHAMGGSADVARTLLRDAFRLDPELVEYGRSDDELLSIRDDIDRLAR